MLVLQTPRLYFSPLELNDVDLVLQIFSDPIAKTFYEGTRDAQQTQAWIEKQLDRYEKNGFGLAKVHLKETGEFVGLCGLILWDDVGGREELEVGYLFVRAHWGKGYATEAAKACLDYASKQLQKKRIISLIQPANIASRKVAEKNGLKVEKELIFFNKPTLVYAKQL